MNHNVLVSRLPAAALVGALAATALTGCNSQAEATNPTLTPTPAQRFNPANSLGTILFAASTTPDGPHDIYVKDLHTGQTTNVTNTPSADELNPQVSPDGNRMVYAGNNTPRGNYQIYRMDLLSRQVIQLTNNTANDFDPTYTPSGNILYKSDAQDGHGDIWTMSGDGLNPRNLTPNMPNTEEWKPTAVGDSIVVFTSRHADDGSMTRQQLAQTDELMLLNIGQVGVAPTQLTNNSWPDWYSEADPGRLGVIAFTSKAAPGGPDVIYQTNVTQPDPNAHRIPLTDPSVLPGDSSDCSWTPDGTLLFVNNGSGKYRAFARTPDGAYYEVVSDVNGDVLSPVAVSRIAVR